MKYAAGFAIVATLIIAGCGGYQVPLAEENNILIDLSILGLWEEVSPGNKSPNPDERMLILKYTDTEYFFHYPVRKDGMYFRGYPIKVEGVSCVQVQLIGTADGDIKKEDRVYHVISYKLSNGELEIRTLNTDLVDKDLQSSAMLREAFLNHKDNKALFTNPGKFRRVKENN
jgi:hypothetical protein